MPLGAHVSAALILVFPMMAVAQEAPAGDPVPLHPLLAAAEALQQRQLLEARNEVLLIAQLAPGFTNQDRVHLAFLMAIQSLDANDVAGARQALTRALEIDSGAQPLPFAPAKWRMLLEEVRPRVARAPGSPDALAEARRDAAAREPTSTSLLRAVDTLYTKLQLPGAVVVLELLAASGPFTPAELAQLSVREGLLKMELGDEVSARAAFKRALAHDRMVRLPPYAPPKTVFIFADEEKSAPVPAPPPVVLDTRHAGVLTGGAGVALVAGGAVAGTVALLSFRDASSATARGDALAYAQGRDRAKVASSVADGLYAAGALAAVTGAFLFLRVPAKPQVGLTAGPALAGVSVGGTF